jgi:hypothetical protein
MVEIETHGDNREEILDQIIYENNKAEGRKIVVLTHDEYSQLKQLLEDRKSISRAWSIIKTALITIAATIVAYNTIYENGVKAISHFLGIDAGK